MKHANQNCGNIFDRDRAEAAVTELLEALGYDSKSERLRKTPERVVDSLRELTSAREFEISTFENESNYSEPLLIKDIAFTSLCEHHLLPFEGVAHVGYTPKNRIVGLSTLPFIVEYFAHRLQLQEKMTDQIADFIDDNLEAKNVAVAIEADHKCMQVRGVRSRSAKTVTTAFRGEDKGSAGFRSWFFNSALGKPASDAEGRSL